MIDGLVRRGAACAALLGCSMLATSVRSDDKPKPDAEKKKPTLADFKLTKPVTEESCTLPDATNKQLLSFAAPQNLMTLARKNQLSQAEFMRFRGFIWKHIGDRIAAANSGEKDQKQAAMYSLQGRASLAIIDPKNYAEDFAKHVAKIKSEKPNTEEAFGASATEFQVNYLSGRKLKPEAADKLFALAKAEPKNPMIGRMVSSLYMLKQNLAGEDEAVAFLESAIKQLPNAAEVKSWKGKLQTRPGQVMTIAGPTLSGTTFDMASVKGKVVLLDFWATWCGPCIQELPHVKEAYEKFNKKGFEIVGISLDQQREKLESFVKDKEMGWPQIIFADAKEMGWQNPVARQYGIESIPAMFLIGKDGKVVKAKLRGPGALAEAIEAELAKPAPTLN